MINNIVLHAFPSEKRACKFTFSIIDCITPGNVTNKNSDTVFFTDTSHNAVYYQWNFGDGNTATTQNPYHIYAQSGFYEVTQIVYDSCNSDSMSKLVNVVVSGISENEDVELVIYPNPAKEVLYVKMQVASRKLQGDFRFEILDLMGRVVKKGLLDDDMSIWISDLMNGIYTIHIFNDRIRHSSSKIAVQH